MPQVAVESWTKSPLLTHRAELVIYLEFWYGCSSEFPQSHLGVALRFMLTPAPRRSILQVSSGSLWLFFSTESALLWLLALELSLHLLSAPPATERCTYWRQAKPLSLIRLGILVLSSCYADSWMLWMLRWRTSWLFSRLLSLHCTSSSEQPPEP